jgi:hypothetical protein
VAIAADVLNRMLELGRPEYVRIAGRAQCAHTADPCNKAPLIVSFSTWVSRGRGASITVALMCPPIANHPFARSSASNRANS